MNKLPTNEHAPLILDREKAQTALRILEPLCYRGPRYRRPAMTIRMRLNQESLSVAEIAEANRVAQFVIDKFAMESQLEQREQEHSLQVKRYLFRNELSQDVAQVATITLNDLWRACKEEKRVELSTVRGWKNQKGFPAAVHTAGKTHTFPKSEVFDWVRRNKSFNV